MTAACAPGDHPCPSDAAVESAAPDAGAADSAVEAAAPCAATGSWTLSENGCTCGGCTSGITFSVGFVITQQLSAEGGPFVDSDDMTWTFDPTTCTASLAGNCDASDTLDFRSRTAACFWTCAGACPPCGASCSLARE